MIQTNRQQRRALQHENKRWPDTLREIPRNEWPNAGPPGITRVWRSRAYLVQEYAPKTEGVVRLSVNRTTLTGHGRWDDAIPWDELQRLKAEAGYGNRWAVEVFPAEADKVNVANMRHLWLLPEPPVFAWRGK